MWTKHGLNTTHQKIRSSRNEGGFNPHRKFEDNTIAFGREGSPLPSKQCKDAHVHSRYGEIT